MAAVPAVPNRPDEPAPTTSPTVPPAGPGRRRRGRSAGRMPVAGAAVAVLLTAVAGCAEAGDATPESTVFGFSGGTLNVVSRHHVPTDLVATDRQDVKVTRWFKADGIGKERTGWTLEDNTLTLEASCSGFANCDARFRVEVPTRTAVLRDGRATDLKGTGAA
ncbi:hypothetical protein [Kitasatospora purpeofusca]|uniref:hypothetical protein n=1 Tax=Kitasatospora purpeofusca TaxID=67352 RepID=UPI0036D39997